MRIRTAAMLGALLAVPLGAAHGQTVESLLAKYAAGRGGRKKIAAVRTLRTTAKIQVGRAVGTATIDQSRPAMLRMDMLIVRAHYARGYDGTRAWQALIADTGGVQIMNALDTRNVAIEAEFDGPLIDPAAGKNKVSLVGRSFVDGNNAYKLQVILNGGGGYVDYYYLDPVTYLPVVWEGTRLVNGRMLKFSTHFRQYKAFGGLRFPTSVETTTNGTPPQTTIITNVEINPTMDQNEFKPPVIVRKKP
jgi:hypothetical protein